MRFAIWLGLVGACTTGGPELSETTQGLKGEEGLVTGALCGQAPTYQPGYTDRGYGCFCGPGNSAGMDAKPLDPMDSCCKDHDLRWTEIEERYRGKGGSCDCRAVDYTVSIVASDGTPVATGIEGIPYDPTTGLPIVLGCSLTCAPVAAQPGAAVADKECALECCEDARIMSTCMSLVPKDLSGAWAVGLGTPGAFEPYDPIFTQPNWGPWNPRYSPDPAHPRGPDPAGNLARCLSANECGDGKCDYVESSRCSCPADCGFGQGMPPPPGPVLLAKMAHDNDVSAISAAETTGIVDIDDDAIAQVAPGIPPPGMGPNNLPIGLTAAAYCPANPAADGICVRIVSEGRPDGPPDPDCPPGGNTCYVYSEDLHETPDHAWVRPDGSPPRGCGNTGQVFQIGYPCAAGNGAALAWIDAWCKTPPDTVKDPGVPGRCNIDPRSIYQNNTWDVIFNVSTSAADRCIQKCTEAQTSRALSCQGDPISECEWFNSCRATCAANLSGATTAVRICAPRPVATTVDNGVSVACATGIAQANAASVSTYGAGTVTCYNYGTTWTRNWGASGEWQQKCTDAANTNYPGLPANRAEQIKCCMDRMTERCKKE